MFFDLRFAPDAGVISCFVHLALMHEWVREIDQEVSSVREITSDEELARIACGGCPHDATTLGVPRRRWLHAGTAPYIVAVVASMVDPFPAWPAHDAAREARLEAAAV